MAEIPSTPADGNTTVLIVPAIADTSAPTSAELTGESVIDISCYLTADGWAPSQEQASIDDSRLCSRQTFNRPGQKTYGLEITYIDNTNSEYSDDNLASETLVEGSDHYLVVRRGVPYEEPVESGQVVQVWPVTAGMQRDVPPEANSVIRTVQGMFVRGEVTRVPVAA